MNCTPEQIEQAAKNYQDGKDPDGNFFLIYKCLKRVILWLFSKEYKIPPARRDELIQDVFLRVYKNMARFQRKSSFRHWVTVIARNVVKDYAEAQQTQMRAGESVTVSLDVGGDDGRPNSRIDVADDSPEADPLAAAVTAQQRRLLREAVESLPPQMRRCVELYFRDYSYQEVADLLGLTRGAVAKHISDAKGKIKAYIASRSEASNR